MTIFSNGASPTKRGEGHEKVSPTINRNPVH